MAIKVTVGQTTFVKKIIVGTPVATAVTGLSIDQFSDFSVATKTDGQILVYDSSENAFKNFDFDIGNGLAKEYSPGNDRLLIQIDSDKTPVVTGLTTKGHIVPTLDSTFDLGDSAKKFRDLYLSGGTIHLGNIDLKDSSGGFAATDSAGDPVNFNLQGSIQQIRNMFASGGDLSYNASTGVFEFDVEQVYTKENFDSDFNVTLDSAVLEGVGLNYSNATNTLNIDSAELESFFKQDIRGYISAADAGGDGAFSYDSSTGVFTYTGPSASEVRAHLAAVDAGGDGSFSYDSSTGAYTYTGPSATEVRSHFLAIDSGGDGAFSYESATGKFIYRGPSATEVRAHMAAVDAGGDGSFSYDSSTGAYTYTGPSPAEVRAHFSGGDGIGYTSGTGDIRIDSAELTSLYRQTIRGYISGTDAGGDGSFTYNATTGTFTYTGPSASEVRAHFTGGSGIAINSGDIKIDSSELTNFFRQHIRGFINAVDAGGDGSFAYDSALGKLTYTGPSASEVRAHMAVVDAGGDGSLTYDSSTGAYTYTGPSASEVRAHFSAGEGIDISSGEISGEDATTSNKGIASFNTEHFSVTSGAVSIKTDGIDDTHIDFGTGTNQVNTDDIPEGTTNLYYTDARADSAAKASLLAGTGVTYDSSTGVIAIGQPVATTDNVTFNQVRGPAEFIIDPATVGDNTGTVKILGNLQVEGTQTVINSTTVSINDKNIVLADSAADAAAADGAGITINGASATLTYSASGDKFVFNKPFQGEYLGFDSDFDSALTTKTTSNLAEGTNLYYTTARADSDAKASLLAIDAGGDGSFTYDSGTGVMTYTGPSASEVRAHFTGGTGITISSGDIKIDSSELTSLYRQTIRGYTSATDAGGDGSFSYNATTGVFTYTGPSASEVRAHFSAIDSGGDGAFSYESDTGKFIYRGPNAAEVRAHFTGGSGIGLSSGDIKIDSAELYSLYKHDDFADFVADEHVAHTGVSIVAGKGLSGGGNIASSRTIDIDSANIRGMFSAGGDLSYNSGTGEFSFDVEAVYTKENFDSDYFLAKDSANTAVERNKHDATTKNFAVTVATKTADHVYNGSGSGQGYVIDGTQSPIVQLQIGRTYRFTLSSSDMSSHPFRFYYDAAKTTQYTTNVTTAATYAEITITEATPPVLHYQCSSHGYMGHALVIGTRNLTGFTTTNLTEGSNLYYTDGRFDTRLAAKTTDNLTEGSSNLYYTDARAQAVSLDSAEAIQLIDSAYVQARQSPATDSAATQAMIDSNFTEQVTITNSGTIGTLSSNVASAAYLKITDGTNALGFDGNEITQSNSGSPGQLFLSANQIIMKPGNSGSDTVAQFNATGTTNLYYNKVKKFETSAYGATVTGTMNADSSTITGKINAGIFEGKGGVTYDPPGSSGTDTATDVAFAVHNGDRIVLGENGFIRTIIDAEWGSALQIGQSGTGAFAGTEIFGGNTGVKLKYSTTTKLETTDSGVNVTGELTADSATIGGLRFPKVDGLNNQVIRTDGNGNLSFVSVAAISGAIDSEAVINLIDSAYVAARSSGGTDSAATQAMIDSNLANNITFGGDVNFDSAGALLFDKSDKSLKFGDNYKAIFGTGGDLEITHTGTYSRIKDGGTGNLVLAVDDLQVTNAAVTENILIAKEDGSVDLYYDNSKKFETTDSGVNITGNLRVNNAPFTSGITVQEEGSSLSTAGTTLNFVGDNVTATGSGTTKTITITGGALTVGTLNNVKADAFVGDNSNRTFTLSNAPADSDDVLIFVNGILQHTNTYSISGDTVTLDSAPDSASEIEARTHLIQSANIVLRDHKSYVYTLDTTTDSVSGADSAGNTLTYDIGKVDVFANGSRLVTGKDFTEVNGTSIVFDSAFSAGNVIEVVSHAKAAVADINGIIAIDSDLTTTGANQIIHTFNATTHRTFKFTAQIEHDSSSSYHAEEVLLTHNGSSVAMTTYAQVLLDSNLGTFDADINSGIVRLKFSPTKTNTSIKLRAIRTTA